MYTTIARSIAPPPKKNVQVGKMDSFRALDGDGVVFNQFEKLINKVKYKVKKK